MKNLLLALMFLLPSTAAYSQKISTTNAVIISATDPTGNACSSTSPLLVYGASTNRKIYQCVSGVYAVSSSSSGTVTSVSVTTANGVSGSVATATTTPALTLTLGAITPSTVTSAGLGTFPTLAVGATSTSSGVLDINGFASVGARTAAAGLGGNWRYRDDTATSRWLTGLLGSGAATTFSIYDLVNSKQPFGINANATTDALLLGVSANTMANPLTVTGNISATAGNLVAGTAGKTLQIKTGSNACSGSSTLSSGTVTVSTTCTGTTWGTDFIVILTPRGSSTGALRVSTHTAATSFVITSSDAGSSDPVGWLIIKQN